MMVRVALPKRIVKVLVLLVVVFFNVILLVLMLHKLGKINLPGELRYQIPFYFQPRDYFYTIDIKIKDVAKYHDKFLNAGRPKHSEGHFGDLGDTFWFEVAPDLSLGSQWAFRKVLFLKNVYYEAGQTYPEVPEEVIVDVAVANPEKDGKIKNNHKRLIPEKVLKDIHKTRVFDAEAHEQLSEANKDAALDGKVDANEILRLKHAQEAEAQAEAEAEAPAKAEATAKAGAETKDPATAVVEKEQKNKRECGGKSPDESDGQDREDGQDSNGSLIPASAGTSLAGTGVAKVKRKQETSRHSLEGYYLIPSEEQLKTAKWRRSDNGIWLKYGPPGPNAVVNIQPFFGSDAKNPFTEDGVVENPLLDTGLSEEKAPRLAVMREKSFGGSIPRPKLSFRSDHKFKILQAADFHFSTGPGKCRDPVPEESKEGCRADPRTTAFFEKVLDLEKPDLVVFTGDQVFGSEAPDAFSAFAKVVDPAIRRKIPYAIVLGNHDDEGNLSRWELMQMALSLPYLVASPGPDLVDGEGNYVLKISSRSGRGVDAVLYLMDSHSRSKLPKTNPGYDWFKDSQLLWLTKESDQFGGNKHLSMAFFHIPLPEWKNLDNQVVVGERREGVGSAKYNSGMRDIFANVGIHAASVGHDHANDYCLLDVFRGKAADASEGSPMWLCYGGGAGEGGYGGYGGYVRRMRVFELDSKEGAIFTWKRKEDKPLEVFDYQKIVGGWMPGTF